MMKTPFSRAALTLAKKQRTTATSMQPSTIPHLTPQLCGNPQTHFTHGHTSLSAVLSAQPNSRSYTCSRFRSEAGHIKIFAVDIAKNNLHWRIAVMLVQLRARTLITPTLCC
jgi:hypothetical protein